MKRIFLLWFLFHSVVSYPQTDFSVIKVDDSGFPKIKVFIQSDSGKITTDDVKIFTAKDRPIECRLKPIEGGNFKQETGVFILLLYSDNEKKNRLINEQLYKVLKSRKGDVKINIAAVSYRKSSLKTDIFSPEFSKNYNFFSEKILSVNTSSEKVPQFDGAMHEILKQGNFSGLKQEKISIIVLGSTIAVQFKNKMQALLLRNNVRLYAGICDTISTRLEQKLIALTSKTGGIYRAGLKEDLHSEINGFIKDAVLAESITNKELYVAEFETVERKRKNVGIIAVGKNKEEFLFHSKHLLSEQLVYQLIILLLIIILIYYIIIFFVQRRRLSYLELLLNRRNTVPDSDKKVVLDIKSEGLSKHIVLKKERYTIGRHDKNDIVLKHETISSFHAEIKKEGGFYYILDNDSTNGVFAGGKKIIKERLSTKFALKLGDIYIKVSYV
ncbi:MAG: FHA domain-containing protein [Bacteroidota bacterium]|nr:FHA domain-containing protein [Bacteroidota bacterium]